MKHHRIAPVASLAVVIAALGTTALLAVTPTAYYVRNSNLTNQNECAARIWWVNPPPQQVNVAGSSGIQEDEADVVVGNNGAENVSSAGMQITSAPYDQANLNVSGLSQMNFAWKEGFTRGAGEQTWFQITKPDGTTDYCVFSGVITSDTLLPGTPVTISGSIQIGWDATGNGTPARFADYNVYVDDRNVCEVTLNAGVISVGSMPVRAASLTLDSFTEDFTVSTATVGSIVTFKYQGWNQLAGPTDGTGFNGGDQSTFAINATVTYP